MNCDWSAALTAESEAQESFHQLLSNNPLDAQAEFKQVRQQLVEQRLRF